MHENLWWTRYTVYICILITFLIWRFFFLLLFVFGLSFSIWLCSLQGPYNLPWFFETWIDSAAEIEGFENSRIITETYSTSFFKAFSSRVVTFLFCTRHKLSCRTRLSFRNTRLKVDVLYILSNVFCQKMPNFTLKVPKILPQIFWLVLLKILAVNSFSF